MLENKTETEIIDIFKKLSALIVSDLKIETDFKNLNEMFVLFSHDIVFIFDKIDNEMNQIMIYPNIMCSPTQLLCFYKKLVEIFNKDLFMISEDFCFSEKGLMIFRDEANFKNIEYNYIEYCKIINELEYSTIQ